ncbi:MAG: sulfite exporter TauE/SafE family protein [Deltaproteobacteria bacterium]|nr:sulfite exporter TauE/SafE family protein [Deltaproteobacteria bacterium]
MYFDISQLQTYQWVLGIAGGMVIGMAKTGLSGLALFFIPLMAISFGNRESTGIILPMLCIGDIFAVAWYRQHGEIKYIMKLLPSTLCGLGVGVVVGSGLSDEAFGIMLGSIILGLLVLMVWQDASSKVNAYPNAWWFSALAGLLAGFTTMIGNAAGAVMSIYLLSMRLPKNTFIGTSAWFFLIINLIKLPLQIYFWKNISPETLAFDALMIPAIAAGALIGFRITGKIPEKAYRIFIIVMTGASAVMLFF